MYLLDTNVVSELRHKNAAPQVLDWVRTINPQAMYISSITLYEIELGIRRVERRDQFQGTMLRNWLNNNVRAAFADRILPLDASAAIRAATWSVPDPKPERDCFIAATAFTHGFSVVTRNTKDFLNMEVTVLDPWSYNA